MTGVGVPEPRSALEVVASGDPRLAPSRDPRRTHDHLRRFLRCVPTAASEVEEVERLLERHGAALADRTTAPGHLTGSALVVDSSNGAILLLLHRKLRRWLQPGGHADGDMELAGVALREAEEETGIDGLAIVLPAADLDLHAVDHGDSLGEHVHLDLRFVVVAPPDSVPMGNHESLGLRWVDPHDLAEVTNEEGLQRLAREGMARVAAVRELGLLSRVPGGRPSPGRAPGAGD